MLNNTPTENDNEELNFTAFSDLCRFCSLRIGPKIHLFEKEAENRQILYKVRTLLPIAVIFLRLYYTILLTKRLFCYPIIFSCRKTIFFQKKSANDVF